MSNQDKSRDGSIDQPRNQISVEKLDIPEILHNFADMQKKG